MAVQDDDMGPAAKKLLASFAGKADQQRLLDLRTYNDYPISGSDIERLNKQDLPEAAVIAKLFKEGSGTTMSDAIKLAAEVEYHHDQLVVKKHLGSKRMDTELGKLDRKYGKNVIGVLRAYATENNKDPNKVTAEFEIVRSLQGHEMHGGIS